MDACFGLSHKNLKGKDFQPQSTKTSSVGIKMMLTTSLTIIGRIMCLKMYVSVEHINIILPHVLRPFCMQYITMDHTASFCSIK